MSARQQVNFTAFLHISLFKDGDTLRIPKYLNKNIDAKVTLGHNSNSLITEISMSENFSIDDKNENKLKGLSFLIQKIDTTLFLEGIEKEPPIIINHIFSGKYSYHEHVFNTSHGSVLDIAKVLNASTKEFECTNRAMNNLTLKGEEQIAIPYNLFDKFLEIQLINFPNNKNAVVSFIINGLCRYEV